MYPVLIMREEAVCLIVLVFLATLSKRYRMGKDSLTFTHLVSFAICHVVMDFVTVWTVNHTETVSATANYIFHVVFYMSAILFSYELFIYVLKEFGIIKHTKWLFLLLVPPALYLLALPVLPIEYVEVQGTFSSTGPAAYGGYGVALVYFVLTILVLIVHRKKINAATRYALVPMMVLLLAAEIAQVFWRELLFTGAAVTLVTVGFFFSLENPVAALEHKMQTDAMTGVYTRNTYEEDIQTYDAEFIRKPDDSYIFLFSDINNLKSVNGLFGHAAGDECISFVAVSLLNGLKNAEKVYRMGGDEFLAVYRKVSEKTVLRDIERVREICEEQSEGMPYKPVVAIGYAVSGTQYRSLRDVLRVADYMMFRNKAEIKRDNAFARIESGTALNLTGLTDSVFDAMCVSSEQIYPFITNMETDVTRVDPAWKEDFGLKDEFFTDFHTVWSERIHPNDRQLFLEDLAEAVNGTKQYHFCRFRALNAEGQYVECTTRGSIYHGKDGKPDIFAGTMYNHGVKSTQDPVTGLPNYDELDDIVEKNIAEGRPFTIMKLGNGNLNRIRIVYGYESSTNMTKIFCDMLARLSGDYGRAFSHGGAEFAILFPDDDKERVRNVFRMIRQTCEAGIQVNEHLIPMRVYGAALCMPECAFADHHGIRGGLLHALNTAYATESPELIFFETRQDTNENMKLLSAVYEDAVGGQKNFYLRFQPLVRASDGSLSGAEALLRWCDPVQGEVSPGRFIDMLENDPCYTALGYNILRWALRDAKKMFATQPDFRISVNITGLQLQDERFPAQVGKILQEEDYPADHLVLELTERCKTMEFSMLDRQAKALRATGIRLALDDMGTGYSTLDLLLNLDVDEVKLDRAFVLSLEHNERSVAYTRTLCESSRLRGTEVCFEGVETGEMAEYIRGFGDVLIQGYWYDRPLKTEEFIAKYAK